MPCRSMRNMQLRRRMFPLESCWNACAVAGALLSESDHSHDSAPLRRCARSGTGRGLARKTRERYE